MKEQNEYILGTDVVELHRLGVHHQVWASEAQKGWELAGFNGGQTLLDLGCGPGFCTKELAYMVGNDGKVIGIDKSDHFIRYLNEVSRLYNLNIEGVSADFNQMKLEDHSLDGMYCRWALAWLSNPGEILDKVYTALKPGGKMVIHEYYDWSTHQIEPQLPGLATAINASLQSFKDSEGEIDIGRYLPKMLTEMGMEISSLRLMQKLATPKELNWQWPKTFYHSYFPRLQEVGYLTQEEVKAALHDLSLLEKDPATTLSCPMMIEVIATK